MPVPPDADDVRFKVPPAQTGEFEEAVGVITGGLAIVTPGVITLVHPLASFTVIAL